MKAGVPAGLHTELDHGEASWPGWIVFVRTPIIDFFAAWSRVHLWQTMGQPLDYPGVASGGLRVRRCGWVGRARKGGWSHAYLLPYLCIAFAPS